MLFLIAGHTEGIDPGAVANNTTEHKEVASLCARVFGMANSEDMILVPFSLTLAEKIAWVNERASEKDLLVSVHMNAAGASAHGLEVLYEAGNSESRVFAHQLYDHLMLSTTFKGRGTKRDSVTRHKRLGILRDTTPLRCALIEFGFLTNVEDLLRVRMEGANALLHGIHELDLIEDMSQSALLLELLQQAEDLTVLQKDLLMDWQEWDLELDKLRGEILSSLAEVPQEVKLLEMGAMKTKAIENNDLIEILSKNTKARTMWLRQVTALAQYIQRIRKA